MPSRYTFRTSYIIKEIKHALHKRYPHSRDKVIQFSAEDADYIPLDGKEDLRLEEQPDEISMEEAKERMDLDDSIMLIDVRTYEEYKIGHIPGAISLPIEGVKDHIKWFVPDLNTQVFVYSQANHRATRATKLLMRLGYARVCNIGSIYNWTGNLDSEDHF